VQLGRGDCLAHSGRVRHGGAAVTKGERIVLVGFVDVVEEFVEEEGEGPREGRR
jgi:hypothetical protein